MLARKTSLYFHDRLYKYIVLVFFLILVCSNKRASATSFGNELATQAIAQHQEFGGQKECRSDSTHCTANGDGDDPLCWKISLYWEFVSIFMGYGGGNDGCTRVSGSSTRIAWSAVFISTMVCHAELALANEWNAEEYCTGFEYFSAHHKYIASIMNNDGASPLYSGSGNPATTTINTGDLVCYGGENNNMDIRDWNYSNFRAWADGTAQSIPTHCDIVVDVVSETQIEIIGGNLGDSIQRYTASKSKYAVVLRVVGAPIPRTDPPTRQPSIAPTETPTGIPSTRPPTDPPVFPPVQPPDIESEGNGRWCPLILWTIFRFFGVDICPWM